MGTLWHVASLSFAANPVRSHREWAGVIDCITLPEPAAPQGSASPRVGALIRCLHRDFTSPNGQGRYALLCFHRHNVNPVTLHSFFSNSCSTSLFPLHALICLSEAFVEHGWALWSLGFSRCFAQARQCADATAICPSLLTPCKWFRFVRLESLEEAYATNKKRRRLAYALRRKQSGSGYKGVWDRLSNDLFIIGEVAFDRCTPRKLHGHAPWWTLMLVAVSMPGAHA